jgi:hypothetical protein
MWGRKIKHSKENDKEAFPYSSLVLERNFDLLFQFQILQLLNTFKELSTRLCTKIFHFRRPSNSLNSHRGATLRDVGRPTWYIPSPKLLQFTLLYCIGFLHKIFAHLTPFFRQNATCQHGLTDTRIQNIPGIFSAGTIKEKIPRNFPNIIVSYGRIIHIHSWDRLEILIGHWRKSGWNRC